MHIITIHDLARVTGGQGPSPSPRQGGGPAGGFGPSWSPQDFQNVRSADNTVRSPQSDHGFRYNTPQVNTPSHQIPDSVFSSLGL